MTQTNRVPGLDFWDLKRLALDCEVCDRTLQRALTGQAVKGISLRRIRRVLAVRGLLDLLPERS